VETTTNELAVALPVAPGPGVMVPDAALTGVSGRLMMSVGRCSDLVAVPLNEEETGESGNWMMSVILALEAFAVAFAFDEEVEDVEEEALVEDSEVSDDDVGVDSDEVDEDVGEASPPVSVG